MVEVKQTGRKIEENVVPRENCPVHIH